MHASTVMSRGIRHACTVPCDMYACIVKVIFFIHAHLRVFRRICSRCSASNTVEGAFLYPSRQTKRASDVPRRSSWRHSILQSRMATSGIQLKISLFQLIDLKRRRNMCQPLQAGQCGMRSDAMTQVDGSRVNWKGSRKEKV